MENMAKVQGNDHQRDGAKVRMVVPEGVMQRLGCGLSWSSCIRDLRQNGPHCGKGVMSRGSIYKVMTYFDRLG